MKFIVTTGYYGTGSSAFTDLLSEFSNICPAYHGDECRFLQDPDGVRTLEFNIVENNHRHNTSHAIKRFKKMCEIMDRKWYHASAGEDFLNATYRYINNITEFTCSTYWHYDNFEKELWFKIMSCVWFKCIYAYNKRARVRLPRNLLAFTHEKGYFSAISREEFYQYTQTYIDELFQKYEKYEYILADQLLPCSNLEPYFNYFHDEVKVIIVDRDPRDIYIEEAEGKYGIPPLDVEEYCRWYEIIRRSRATESFDPEKVLLVQFEDLIYRYETTCSKVLAFLQIDEKYHVKQRENFIPEESKNNTNLVVRYPKYRKQTEYIENKLQGYLYHME